MSTKTSMIAKKQPPGEFFAGFVGFETFVRGFR
jgi:hypothetical protein